MKKAVVAEILISIIRLLDSLTRKNRLMIQLGIASIFEQEVIYPQTPFSGLGDLPRILFIDFY